MIIKEKPPVQLPETVVRLSNVRIGDVFRYAEKSFQEALTAGEFFMCVSGIDHTVRDVVHVVRADGRVFCPSGDKSVIVHPAELFISER